MAAMIALISCDSELENKAYVVSGFYRADTDKAEVSYFQLKDNGEKYADERAIVQITIGNGSRNLQRVSDDEYVLDGELNFNPGDEIALEIESDRILSASATIPPLVNIEAMGNSMINIDPGLPGEEVFSLKWTEQEGYSYLLRLECIEPTLVEIPFTNGGGLFENTFRSPIVESSALIYASDFKYYGAHRLTIFILNNEYANLFFTRNGSIGFVTTESFDNIDGGKGIWTSINAVDILLEVQ